MRDIIMTESKSNNSNKLRPSADKTRKKILLSAQKIFAQNGFSGASISKIAAKANINKSLIYHHFADKSSLWKAVKSNIIEDFIFKIEHKTDDYNLKLFLQDFVTFRINHFRKNPELVRMLLWQRLEPIDKNISFNMQSSFRSRLETIIKNLQDKKQIRKDVPMEMLVSCLMAGVSSSDFEFKTTLYKDEASWQQYIDFTIDCLYKSLNINSQ
jgi:AcrR family transcriptional regulator